jgi:hypothetical protein
MFNRCRSGPDMRWPFRTSAAFIVAGSILPAAQLPRAPADLAWVGLYNDQLIEWLENENRIDELCPDIPGKVDDRVRCRDEKLRAKPYVVVLRRTPSTTAPSPGSLLLVATPGKGLQFFYVPARGGAAHEFTPDLNLDDWGYGPFYHETFLERRGDWFLLPEDPFPAGTWLNARDLGDDPHILAVEGIVSSPRGNLVVLAVDRDVVRVRPEQPADLWCESSPPPPLQPWTEVRIPRGDLYSRTGHLLVAPAHMKGC